MKNVALWLLVVLCTSLIAGCNYQLTPPDTSALEARLAAAEAEIVALKEADQKRIENDRIILFVAPYGGDYIERGLITLGSQLYYGYPFEELDTNTSYIDETGQRVYPLSSGIPAIRDNSTGEWWRIEEADWGETIVLSFARGDENDYLAYFTCYTNATLCTSHFKTTSIWVN